MSQLHVPPFHSRGDQTSPKNMCRTNTLKKPLLIHCPLHIGHHIYQSFTWLNFQYYWIKGTQYNYILETSNSGKPFILEPSGSFLGPLLETQIFARLLLNTGTFSTIRLSFKQKRRKN